MTPQELAERGIRVKPLVWREIENDRGDGHYDLSGEYEAECDAGLYSISVGFGSDSYYWGVIDPFGNDVGLAFDDPARAKSAAEADHAARIAAQLALIAEEEEQ